MRLEALCDMRLAGVEITTGQAFEVLDGSAARMLLAAGAAVETDQVGRVTIVNGSVAWSEPEPWPKARAPRRTWMTNYGEWK